jgi:4-amino-4-deoxy-L-arabinose transferase-like glycosyltransferase
VLVGAVIDATIPVIKRADVYSDIAANLARGHGFVAEPGGEPLIWRAPLYPAFLAVLYRLFGEHNSTAVFIAQAILDAITGVLIYWMGTRLFSESVGFFSAAIFALNPLSAYYSLRFMCEPLFTLAFTAAIAAWLLAVQNRRSIAFMVVGVLVAVAALVKPVALGLLPLLAACAFYRRGSELSRAMSAAVALTLTCLLVLLPWTWRNYRVTGEIVPVATGEGYALWLGNQMASEGHEDWELDHTTRAHLLEQRVAVFDQAGLSSSYHAPALANGTIPLALLPINITVEEDRAFLRAAWMEIASHPFDSGLLIVRKFFRFWFRIFLPENRWAQPYIVSFQTFFLSFAILGIMEAKRREESLFPLLFPVLFLTGAHVLTFATIRYSMPVVPIMTIFMVVGLREVVRGLNERLGLSLGMSWARWLRAVPIEEPAAAYRRSRE